MITIRRVDFYPADFLTGVIGMSAELIGVYWIICTLLYLNNGTIQTDDRRLKSAAGVSYHRLPGALKELAKLGKISIGEDGAITQQRVSKELARTAQRISKARASGAQGGRPPKENNDLEKPDGFPSEKLSVISHQPSVISGSNEPALPLVNLPAPDPEKTLFDEGKRILGKSAGGQIVKLRKHAGGDADKALAMLRLAAGKSDPASYVGAILRGDPEANHETALAEIDADYRRMGVR